MTSGAAQRGVPAGVSKGAPAFLSATGWSMIRWERHVD
jgi:hypothetical protein